MPSVRRITSVCLGIVTTVCVAFAVATPAISRAQCPEPADSLGCSLGAERLARLAKVPYLDLDVIPVVYRGDYYSKAGWQKMTPKIDASIFAAISGEMAPERKILLPGLALPGGGCGPCAVVGASGNLLGSNYGSEIDRHRLVIRTSHAPISGYERDVGTRSNYHFMVANLNVEVEYDPEALLIVTPRNEESMQWIFSHASDGSMKTPPSRIRVLSASFTEYVQRRWFGGSPRWASTGLRAIVFALHYCNEIDVYGFGADAEGNWDHYYDLEKKLLSNNQFHDIALEAKLIDELAEKGLIRIHRGNVDRR